MVTNAKLWEIVRRVEAFVGITNEVMEDPMLVDLLMQIVNSRQDADKIWGDACVFQGLVDEYMAETLNFHEAMEAQLESLHKDNENLRAEIIVLCRAVAVLSLNRGELSKFRNLKPLVVQGVQKSWKT